MPLSDLKKACQSVDELFLTDKISPSDIVKRGGEFQEKVSRLQEVEETLERLARCKSAGEVFGEFAKDAAAAKVAEMVQGKTSSARQRAQETVLDYALGKPIQRTMTMGIRVSDAREEELEHDIRSLMVELGFANGQGKASPILIGTQGTESQITIIENESEPRVSGEVRSLVKTGTSDPDGKSGGENPH